MFWKNVGNGFPRTCHELSTSVRWLSDVDIAWLIGLRDGSLRACSSALSCGNDVGSDVPDELDKEDVVDKPGTIFATCSTCNRRHKSACWRISWQVFPKYFRSQFGEDIADLYIDCVDVQWLLALLVRGNPSDSPRRSSWTSPRTWMVPCQGWSSWSPPINFNCPSAVFWGCHQCGRDHLLRVGLHVVEFWRVFFLST